MNKVKIKLQLDLDSSLGRNVFSSLADALSGSELKTSVKSTPVIELVKEAPEASAEEEKAEVEKPKRTRTKPVVEPAPEVEVAEKVAEETAETEKEAEVETEAEDPKGITLADIKAVIPKKVSKHRDAIKGELTRLGAENSDKLDKKLYPDFLKFLNDLA